MKFGSRDSLIMLGAAVLMVVLASVLVYMRQGSKLEQLRTRIVTQQAALETAAQDVAVVPEMIRQVQALKNRYSDFDRKLPKSKELHEFLRQISGSLAQADLTNQSIEPGSPTRQEYFNTLPIIMKFRGPYLSLANFLDHMEKMERLSRVQKLVITADERSNELGIELQMNIYFTES